MSQKEDELEEQLERMALMQRKTTTAALAQQQRIKLLMGYLDKIGNASLAAGAEVDNIRTWWPEYEPPEVDS